jgi:phospholipid-transporting ATPase
MLLTALGKAALITKYYHTQTMLTFSHWTKWTIFAIPGSFVIWMVFLPVYATVAPLLGFSEEYAGILPHLYTTILFWASIAVIPILCLLRDFAWR